jgi:mannitol/fructose-specific phosphotransferase system IIA component (Ntr-type)
VEPLDVATKDDAIRSLTCRLGDLGLVPPDISDEIVATIRDREDLGVAGAVGGIAIPHARHPAVRRTVGIVGYSTSGIDFNSLNNEPVKTVILVLSPTDQPVEHLRALEWISRTLRNALT